MYKQAFVSSLNIVNLNTYKYIYRQINKYKCIA